ncbi:MAG: hypothetical protein ACK55Z_01675, partial [bacterium]
MSEVHKQPNTQVWIGVRSDRQHYGGSGSISTKCKAKLNFLPGNFNLLIRKKIMTPLTLTRKIKQC